MFSNSNPAALNHFIHLCTTCKSLNQVKQVHHHIILHGLSPNPHLHTKLLQTYAAFSDISSASRLFSQLPHPNVFAWTAILTAWLGVGNHAECLETYAQLKAHRLSPDGYVLPLVLRACSRSLDLDRAVQLHADVVKFGIESNSHVCNSLVGSYSKCHDIESARGVFDEMAERDLLSWNLLISGFVGNGDLNSALEALRSMEMEGFEPDVITLNIVMDAYGQMGRCKEAFEVFNRIKDPNVISWTILIMCCSRSGKHGEALSVFRDMIGSGRVSPDLDTISCVLSSCRHLLTPRTGRELHGYVIKEFPGAQLHNSMGVALVTLYAACKRIKDATRVFEMMDGHDVVAWNAMILGFVQVGLGKSAVQCFYDMQARGVENDQVTICTVLPVCSLELGKQIHARVIRTCFELPTLVGNALINMYSKSGCVEFAHAVFSNMPNRDVVSWNTMIGGYGVHGQGRAALKLLHEMKQLGIQPNSVTFVSVISACSHSGLVSEGMHLFSSLNREFNFEPTMEQFGCVVDLLARAGRLEEAVDFIRKMPIEPDGSVWGALLASCRVHQNVEFGRLAAEHLFCIEPENPGNYVTLSNIYMKAGREEDALRMRKMMECRGLMKPSGYSWVEAEE